MSDVKYLSIYADDEGINFKVSNGVFIIGKIVLELKPNESLLVLELLHKVVRESTLLHEASASVTVGRYDLTINCVRIKNNNTYDCSLSIGGMENLGEMSRPIESIKFDKYIGGNTMLDGVRKAKKNFEESLCDIK